MVILLSVYLLIKGSEKACKLMNKEPSPLSNPVNLPQNLQVSRPVLENAGSFLPILAFPPIQVSGLGVGRWGPHCGLLKSLLGGALGIIVADQFVF